jgi:hypothetical protein
MPRHQLNKPNNVHGPFSLQKGRLSFRTGDAGLVQRLQADRAAGRPTSIHLLSADPIEEFTGALESVELVSGARPAQWEVVMVEHSAKSRKRV